MKPYKNFQPTGFDSKGLGLPDQQDWLQLEGVTQTRDSGPLERSNFAAAVEMLGGESDTVEVHRFGHWGPGWFEIILIDPSAEDKVKIGKEIESRLVDYPILDDEAFSELENEEIEEAWSNFGYSEITSLLCKELDIDTDSEIDTDAFRSWLEERNLVMEIESSGAYLRERSIISTLENTPNKELWVFVRSCIMDRERFDDIPIGDHGALIDCELIDSETGEPFELDDLALAYNHPGQAKLTLA